MIRSIPTPVCVHFMTSNILLHVCWLLLVAEWIANDWLSDWLTIMGWITCYFHSPWYDLQSLMINLCVHVTIWCCLIHGQSAVNVRKMQRSHGTHVKDGTRRPQLHCSSANNRSFATRHTSSADIDNFPNINTRILQLSGVKHLSYEFIKCRLDSKYVHRDHKYWWHFTTYLGWFLLKWT